MPAAMSKLLLVAPCCVAMGAQLKGRSSFLSKSDPAWEGEKIVQQDHPIPSDTAKYHGDYPKDERPDVHGDRSWTHVTVAAPDHGPDRYTAPWYVSECKKINDHCVFIRDHRLGEAREDLTFLENEYLRLKKIYDDRKGTHQDEQYDVDQIKNQIAEAKMIIEEYAHCPPELQEAKDKLDHLEGIHDKVPADIEEECDVQKVVIEKERCVAKLRDAEDLLARHTAALPSEKTEENKAERKLDPAEERMLEAKARWENARDRGINPSAHALSLGCQREVDELMSTLRNDVGRLYEIYMAERGIREGHEDKHEEEQTEVEAQEKDEAAAKAKVDKAEVTVKKFAHCPPELEAAEAQLAALERIPNKSEHDIEEECDVEKKIIKARACVEELRAAEEVLMYHDGIHGTEKSELNAEQDEAAAAAAKVPPQSSKTAAAKAAWLAAKALFEESQCKLHDDLQ